MAEKFTYGKHQERMRQIISRAKPTGQPDVMQSLLERIRTRKLATPKLPKI